MTNNSGDASKRKIVDWSRPRTWVVIGVVLIVVGAVIEGELTAEGDTGIGYPVMVCGWAFVGIGVLAWLVTQVLKAVAAARDE